ncbi:MAG: NUDIX domain-containing protein, partial [Rhodoluna sp.]
GIDQGETPKIAALRELFEETGLKVSEKAIFDPILVTEGRWDWADGLHYHTYKDIIFELVTDSFEPDTSGFTQDEHRDVLEYRWWDIEDLLATDEPVGPHELRTYLESRFRNNR